MPVVLPMYLINWIDVFLEQCVASCKQGQHQEQGQKLELPCTDTDDQRYANDNTLTNFIKSKRLEIDQLCSYNKKTWDFIYVTQTKTDKLMFNYCTSVGS